MSHLSTSSSNLDSRTFQADAERRAQSAFAKRLFNRGYTMEHDSMQASDREPVFLRLNPRQGQDPNRTCQEPDLANYVKSPPPGSPSQSDPSPSRRRRCRASLAADSHLLLNMPRAASPQGGAKESKETQGSYKPWFWGVPLVFGLETRRIQDPYILRTALGAYTLASLH